MEYKKFFIFILFALFLHLASCDIITIKQEEKENFKCHENSPSNHDGAILLYFCEINNENNINIHLRLIPKNKTIIPIKVYYKFPEINFNITESNGTTLLDSKIKSYILNGEYILIRFLEAKDGLLKHSGLILSWNGEITRYLLYMFFHYFYYQSKCFLKMTNGYLFYF